MKYKFLFSLSFAVILFSACQKEENMYTPDSIAQSEAMKKSKAVSNLDSSLNAYPQIKFKFGGKDNQLVRVVLFDSLFKNYDNLQVDVEVTPHINSNSQKEAVKPYVKTTAYSQAGVDLALLRSEPVQYTESFTEKVVDVTLTLISNGQKVDSRSFSVFVFENGKSALQKPELISSIFIDDWQGETSYLTANVILINDPANQVKDINLLLNGYQPETSENSLNLITTNPKEHPWVKNMQKKFPEWHLQLFSSNVTIPALAEFLTLASNCQTTISMLGIDNMIIGEKANKNMEIQKSDFTGRIRRVRIRETGGSMNEYRIAAVIENVNDKRFDFVEVKFNEPFNGPKPNSMLWRMSKRPEMLYQAWDATLQDYISEINNNPLFVAGNDPVLNPLFFEKPAVGYTYSVTTTIYNKNGKVMGEPQTFEVTVEGETDNTEPVVQSTRLFSTDGGKTWNYEVVIQDNGQWVEKVNYEFAKPYIGPAPLQNPINLTRIGEAPGNIEVYSVSGIKFDGDPTGNWYDGIVYQFGIGTRSTTSQANNKAELL